MSLHVGLRAWHRHGAVVLAFGGGPTKPLPIGSTCVPRALHWVVEQDPTIYAVVYLPGIHRTRLPVTSGFASSYFRHCHTLLCIDSSPELWQYGPKIAPCPVWRPVRYWCLRRRDLDPVPGPVLLQPRTRTAAGFVTLFTSRAVCRDAEGVRVQPRRCLVIRF